MYTENISIEGKTLYLDGATMHNCKISNCKLVFSGYQNYSLSECHFEECSWVFNGPASATLQFLRSMHRAGANEMVENVVKAIIGNDAIPGVPEDLP